MKRIAGLIVLNLCAISCAFSQVDTSYIYNTNTPYGTLDLRIAKSPTRYYYLQEGVTFSYRESAPGVKTNTYTPMTNWNTSAYGEGNLREVNGSSDNFAMNYRLLKPRDYDEAYPEGYPMIVMFHGAGEAANCWVDTRCYWATARYNPVTNSPAAPTTEDHALLNNDRNLLHGGAQHLTAVNLAAGKFPDDPTLPDRAFPGFVLFPQSLNGWGPHGMVEDAIRIVRLLIKKYNIDESRIYIHGLSNGGGGVYQALKRAPWLFAAALPMSAINDGGISNHGMVEEVSKIPLWIFQGGQDTNPTPNRTYHYVRNFRNAGGEVRYYLYPHLGHGTWNTAYKEPDFFSWMLGKRKYNPHIYFGDPYICTATNSGVRMAFSDGFFAYQWERDGQVIPGATGSSLVADVPGTYRGRFSRKPNPTEQEWERWSDPIVVSEYIPEKPPVEIVGTAHLRGPGLPSTDPFNSVQLKSAGSAEFYEWYKDGALVQFPGMDVADTLRTATFTSGSESANGSYTLVTKRYNCPSPPSDPINLFFNNSSPQNMTIGKDAVDLKGMVTASDIFLSWNDVSGAENGYELWRRQEGAPYFEFVTRTSEDAVSYHDRNLNPGTIYAYKLRAVNNSGRSNYLPSDDLNVNYTFTTLGDHQFPSPPQDLVAVDNTLNTITLSWKPAKDENKVKTYYVYYNSDSVDTRSAATQYTLTGLTRNSVYRIKVKALDFGNHLSAASNQIIATTYLSGLIYKHSTGTWESLDDSAMIASFAHPEFTGTVDNFSLEPRTQNDYFNFQFSGYLNIEAEGTYYFDITSDDGSRLYIDGVLIADNDGKHGRRTVASEGIHLTAGPHAIVVEYFDDVGGQYLSVRYKGPGVGDGMNFVVIPDAALRSGTYIAPVPPVAPTGLTATPDGMNKVTVGWQFAGDPADVEIYRAESADGQFEIVTTATGTSAVDSIGLVPGTTYYYKTRAVNNNGASEFSSVVSATTAADDEAPGAPQGLTVVSKTTENVAITWEPSTDNVGVVGYEVYADDELIGTSTLHAFTAEGLSPNTLYTLTVRAVDASGNRSEASATVSVLTNTSTIFYSAATGALNNLSTWHRNQDGTGESPANFTDNGQYFMVMNRTSAALDGAWTIGGNASRVVVSPGVTFSVDYPFTANIELQGDAILNLDDTSLPDLVRLSPESTVDFNGPATVPAADYGHVVLSGTTAKTFEGDTTVIRGTLTIGEGLALKGGAHNSTLIQLWGSLVLIGTRPATAADNAIDLRFAGAGPNNITTGGDLHLFQISTVTNASSSIENPSGSPIEISVGSRNGGGLSLANGSALAINNNHLIVHEEGTVNASGQTGVLSISGGDLTLATSSAADSHLMFHAEQNVVNRLTIQMTGAGGAIVGTPLRIREGIKVRNGTLHAESNVTLLATSESTAAVYAIENDGRITGDITVQQHLEALGTVYRDLSAPVDGVTVASWQQYFPITGSFSGSSSSVPGNAPSLFVYRETDGGWIAYPPAGGSNTAPIERGVGYSAQLRNSDEPVTLAVTGTPFQGDITLPVGAGTEGPAGKGWNLVGNPYASPILWTGDVAQWTRSGVNNVIAIRNNTIVGGVPQSQMTYYDPRINSGVIPAGTAFWVRAYSATPSLILHEQAKVDPDNVMPSPASVEHLVVRLKQGDLNDATYLLFSDAGTVGLDDALDGRKLKNQGMFNLSSITADTVRLAVNDLGAAVCATTVGLDVSDVSPGSYALAFENMASLSGALNLVLNDHFTGTQTTITGTDYTFSVTDNPASYGRERFSITLSRTPVDVNTPVVSAGVACAPGPASVTVGHTQEAVLYQVIDVDGNAVSERVAGNGGDITLTIPSEALVSGANNFQVTAGFDGCDRIQLPGVLAISYGNEMTVTTAGDVSVCEGADVTLTASGAPDGGFYKWFDSNGDRVEGATADTLHVEGVNTEVVYYVSAAHPNGCESPQIPIHIYADTLDMPVILVKADTLYTDVTGYYQWKKDGEEIPGATFYYFVPVEDGQYTVLASNGGCYKESEPYQIGDPVTGIEGGRHNEFVLNVYPVPTRGDAVNVLLRSPNNDPVLIEIIDAMGRLHFSGTIEMAALAHGLRIVPQVPLYRGIYFLRVRQANVVAQKKIIVKDGP